MTTAEELTTDEALAKIQEARDALKNAMDTYGKKAITSLIDRTISKHKGAIDGIVWTQYTPYFNDGDPCEFSVHEINVIPKNENPRDCMYENEVWSLKDKKEDWVTKELIDDLKRVDDVFGSNDEIMNIIFGDHVMVIANADGILVEEYDHD